MTNVHETNDELEIRFLYHRPTDEQVGRMQLIRNKALGLARLVADAALARGARGLVTDGCHSFDDLSVAGF